MPIEYLDLSGMVKSFIGFLPPPYDDNLVMLCETHGHGISLGISQIQPQFFAVTSVCATYAMSIGSSTLVSGYNLTDLTEDASRYKNIAEINGSIGSCLSVEGKPPFTISMPLSKLTKAQVIQLGHGLNVPLPDTWSCWADTPRHCGECPGCDSRKRAFEASELGDSTVYLDRVQHVRPIGS